MEPKSNRQENGPQCSGFFDRELFHINYTRENITKSFSVLEDLNTSPIKSYSLLFAPCTPVVE